MRARNIKPGFWKNEDLVELPFEHRLLFVGLWMLADREGRLEDRPKRVKMELFPCDNVNVEAGLEDLTSMGLLERYEYQGVKVIVISKFLEHQSPHHSEKRSELPGKGGYDSVSQPKKAKQAAEKGKSPASESTDKQPDTSGDEKADNVDGSGDAGDSQVDAGEPTVGETKTYGKPTVGSRNHTGESRPDSLNPDSPNPESIENTIGPSASDEPTQSGPADDDDQVKPQTYPQEFELAWQKYPKRPGSNPKRQAFKAWKARTKEGYDPAHMLAGVVRYAKFCKETDKTGTEFVMQAVRFFGPSCEFENEWSPPARIPRPGGGMDIDAHNREVGMRWASGAAAGDGEVYDHE